ncbi:MAG: carotenoid oxygenase family protein, partial [Halobacteriota archaeon]
MDRDGGPGDAALGFESLDGEVEVDSLDVEGNVPSWLEGSLYRNGPACFEVDGRSLEHWFDGYAMLHLFDFEDGDVAYANRYLDTDAYRSSRDDGMTYAEFATDPCRDLFERVFSFFLPPDPTDNANVNVTKVAEEYVAMTETPLPVEFDPESLETLGVADYERHLDGHLTTAHPHHDDERGLTYNYVTEIGPRSTYRLTGVDDDGGSTEVGSRSVRRPSYMHSFGMTEDHLVLSEWPLVVDPLSLVLGNSPFVSSYRWKPERGTWFTVFDKDSGEVVARCHDDRPAFAFHHVNAFERDGEFVVDVALYDDASVIDELYLDRLRSEDGPEVDSRLARYTLDPGSNEASYEVVADEVFELPRFDYARRGGV